jgi:hypothetical protein
LVVEEKSTAALELAIYKLRDDPELRARLVKNALKAAEQFEAKTAAKHLRDVIGSGSASRKSNRQQADGQRGESLTVGLTR